MEAAKEAGQLTFEFGGGARFQSPYFFYLQENAFEMMDKFRQIGPDANLQTLSSWY